jgi:hypothetical protein
MKLVIKLYQDRPSRIGILYKSVFEASKTYTAILEKYLGETFQVTFEFVKNKITLRLISNESLAKIEYRDIDYEIADLKKLSVFIKPNTELEFVHVYNTSNKLMIAKPNLTENKEFIRINNYEIILHNKINN